MTRPPYWTDAAAMAFARTFDDTVWMMFLDAWLSENMDLGINKTFPKFDAFALDFAKQQEDEVARLREALRPFANYSRTFDEIPGVIITRDNVELWQPGGGRRCKLTVGDLRRAAAALGETHDG